MRPVDPQVQAYLDQLNEKKGRSEDVQSRIDQLAMVEPKDYSIYDSLAKASAGFGAIGGGQVADTSTVQDASKALGQQDMMQQKLALNSLQGQQDQIDKDTGLNMKTLEYLQNRQDRSQDRAEDKAFRNQQVAESNALRKDEFDLKKQELDRKSSAPAVERAPNADQFKAAGFAKRVEQANQAFEALEKVGYSRNSALEGAKSYLPNAFQGDELQQQTQAESNFVNALLRRESGAAISTDEFAKAEKQYFPRAGDGEAALALKRQNRDQALNTLRAEGGAAFEKIPSAPLISTSESQPSGSAQGAILDTGSVSVQAPDGSVRRVPKDRLEQALAAGGKLMGQ